MEHRARVTRLALPIALALCLVLIGGAGLAFGGDAPGFAISGVVTGPGGALPLPAGQTVVKLLEANGETVRGQAVADNATGAFSLGPVPGGLYLLRADPPAASGLTPSVPQPAPVVNASISGLTLTLTHPQLTGVVAAPDGVTPVTATVVVRAGERLVQRVPAPGGQFVIGGLPAGAYQLRAFRVTDDPYYDSPIVAVGVPTTTTPVTLTLTSAQLYGVVKKGADAVGGATVIAARPGLQGLNVSSPSGYWAIGGLPNAGEATLRAFPPYERPTWLPSEPQVVDLAAPANPYTLTLLTAPKIVTGVVKTNTEIPVVNALVTARRLDARGEATALTNGAGAYRLDLTPGLWALTVRHTPDSSPSAWVYNQPPQSVHFRYNQEPESWTVNFTVITADAGVQGVVKMPDGATTPPFTVTVGILNDEGAGREVRIDPATGAFSVTVPNGVYKVVVVPHDPGYLGPAVPPVTVPPSTTVNLGTLTLLARDAAITGTVTDEAGAPAAGIPVSAWRAGVPGAVTAETGPDGAYVLSVAAGAWQVRPHPGPDQPYLYRGEPASVTVGAGATATDVDFSLITADATIRGAVVDEAGQVLGDTAGFARATHVISPALSVGAPIEAGLFTLHVAPGTYNVVARLPAGAEFFSTAEVSVTLAAGETKAVTLTVRAKTPNTAIAGAVVNVRTGVTVPGLAGEVMAWAGDDWVARRIGENGLYRLEVAPGVWHLDYRIQSEDYVKVAGVRRVPVRAGQTAEVNLPVLAKDGTLTGTVLLANGGPAAGVRVAARGVLPPVRDQWFTALTNDQGHFRMKLPSGLYRVGAGAPEGGVWPVEREVVVPPNGSASVTLQFRAANAVLSGALTISGSTASGPAFLWAWSEDGGFARVTVPITDGAGVYSLDVVSGTLWHVRALFGTSHEFWFGRGRAEVNGDTTLNITLEGPRPRPGPVVVTFDAAEPQSLTLSDGTDIYLPAGALPATGQVTLRVEPILTLVGHRGADVFRYGYAFLAADSNGQPITANFNQNVIIRFPYDEAELARLGIREERLRPAYFSTTTNSWSYPESYVVDTDANVVTMQVDHFTDFALTAQSAATDIFLPLVGRQ